MLSVTLEVRIHIQVGVKNASLELPSQLGARHTCDCSATMFPASPTYISGVKLQHFQDNFKGIPLTPAFHCHSGELPSALQTINEVTAIAGLEATKNQAHYFRSIIAAILPMYEVPHTQYCTPSCISKDVSTPLWLVSVVTLLVVTRMIMLFEDLFFPLSFRVCVSAHMRVHMCMLVCQVHDASFLLVLSCTHS